MILVLASSDPAARSELTQDALMDAAVKMNLLARRGRPQRVENRTGLGRRWLKVRRAWVEGHLLKAEAGE